MVENICCSCRGPGFIFQHLHCRWLTTIYNTKGSNTLIWFLWRSIQIKLKKKKKNKRKPTRTQFFMESQPSQAMCGKKNGSRFTGVKFLPIKLFKTWNVHLLLFVCMSGCMGGGLRTVWHPRSPSTFLWVSREAVRLASLSGRHLFPAIHLAVPKEFLQLWFYDKVVLRSSQIPKCLYSNCWI